MNEPTLPHDKRAEQSLVASIMVDPDAIDLVAHIVTAEEFYFKQHGAIFDAASDLWARGVSVNQVTVAAQLGEKLDEVGGLSYLANLTSELPTAVGCEHYAEIVHRMAALRKAIQAGSNIVRLAYDRPSDLDGFLGECERMLAEVQGQQTTDLVPIGELLDRYWSEPGVMDRTTNVLRTGWFELDRILCGVGPGNLAIIAARPGMGKSTVLLNIARNAAVGQAWKVAIVSLEMSEDEWRDRLLACETGIAIDQIRGRALQDAPQARAFSATQEISAWPLYVRDKPAQTVEQIRAYAKRLKASVGLDLLLIDYLQLIGVNRRKGMSRYEEVSDISRTLKMLARELHIPIIAAAQLNREVEKRSPPKPMLSDLRDSGSIEQDADQVMMLYRADKYADVHKGVVEVIVNKNRHGPTGVATVRIDDATAKISERNEQPAPWA